MNNDISEMSEQIQRNVAEGKRLCGDIQQKLDERNAVIKALRAVGIEVDDSPPRLSDVLKPKRCIDTLKCYIWRLFNGG